MNLVDKMTYIRQDKKRKYLIYCWSENTGLVTNGWEGHGFVFETMVFAIY